MRRRSFLQRLAATGLLAGSAGCAFDGGDSSDPTDHPTGTPVRLTDRPPATDARDTDDPTPTATPSVEERVRERYADRFDAFVNVVEAGADPTGDNLLDDVVADAVGDDTLLYFPEGTYGVRSLKVGAVENVGLVAEPDADVTLAPQADASAIDGLFLRFLGASDLLVRGFELDFREEGRGGLFYVWSDGDFEVRDVRVRGQIPRDVIGFMAEIRDESGTGVVRNLDLTDGAHPGGDSAGIYVGRQHAGELRFEDCRVANFTDNGLYGSTPGADNGGGGTVHVRGGEYRNNNISNVRIGGDGSTVRDVTIVMDEVPPHDPASLNARGIRVRQGRDHEIRNCRIEIGADAGEGFGGVVVHPDGGATTVADTEIEIDRDGMHAINVASTEDREDDPNARGLSFENVAVSGNAADDASVLVTYRDHTVFRDCEVRQSGADRDGFAFESARDCVVSDSQISVPGSPIRRENAEVQTRNLRVSEPGAVESGAGDGQSEQRYDDLSSHD